MNLYIHPRTDVFRRRFDIRVLALLMPTAVWNAQARPAADVLERIGSHVRKVL